MITNCDQMAKPNDHLRQAALPLACILLLLMLHPCRAQPSPGYYPSKMFRSLAFSEGYSTLWGPQHQTLSQDQKSLTVWMDRSSGDRLIDRSIDWPSDQSGGLVCIAHQSQVSTGSICKTVSAPADQVPKMADSSFLQEVGSNRRGHTGTATSARRSRCSRATPPASTRPSTYVGNMCLRLWLAAESCNSLQFRGNSLQFRGVVVRCGLWL